MDPRTKILYLSFYPNELICPNTCDQAFPALTKVNPIEVSVVEDFSDLIENVEVDVDQAEDTISILNKYVDGLTLPVESDKIKTVLRDVYNEALSMETL